jgi:hypothetical protein
MQAIRMMDDQEQTDQPAGPLAPFEIDCAPDRHFLHMTIRGVWDETIFEAFGAAYAQAIADMAPHGGVQVSLVDGSAFGVQPAELADGFASLLLRVDPAPERRSAFVTSALVNKVQARQVGDVLNTRYFKTVDSAIEWLFGEEA